MAEASDPASNAFAITPSDTADMPNHPRAIYVGTAGDIKVTTTRGDVVTFSSVANGIFPVEVARVWATGTTATGLVGLY